VLFEAGGCEGHVQAIMKRGLGSLTILITSNSLSEQTISAVPPDYVLPMDAYKLDDDSD